MKPKPNTLTRTSSLFLCVVAMAACGESKKNTDPKETLQPIDSATAVNTANENLKTSVAGIAQSAQFLEEMETVQELRQDDSCTPETPCEPPPPIKDEVDEFLKSLAEQIFNTSNVETQEATSVSIRIMPDKFCKDDQTAEPDSECVNILTQIPVRLTVTSPSENNVNIAVFIGEDRLHVADFEIHQDHLAVEVDFGLAFETLKRIAAVTSEQEEIPQGTVSGRGRGEIRMNGQNDFTVILSVLQAIDVDLSLDGKAVQLNIQTAQPAATVRINGQTEEITVQMSWNGVDFVFPLELLPQDDQAETCSSSSDGGVTCEPAEPPEPIQGILGGHLLGFLGQAILKENAERFQVTGLSFGNGPASLTINNNPLLSFELNPGAGHTLDLSLEPQDQDVVFRVLPLLDLSLNLNLGNLPENARTDVPAWALDESFTIRLDGHAEPAVKLVPGVEDDVDEKPDEPIDGSDGGNEPPADDSKKAQLEVLAGQLTLTSRALSTQIVVEQGMCLVPTDPMPENEDAHPFESVHSGVCE